MKTFSIFSSIILFLSIQSIAQDYSPYYNLGSKSGSISQMASIVKNTAKSKGFTLIGEYAPGTQNDLYVLVFTNSTTISITSKAHNQGVIASSYRVGLEQKGTNIQITAVNPEYQWIAYLGKNYSKVESQLKTQKSGFDAFCKAIGNGELKAMGGKVKKSDLEEYQYMFGMPYFDDQIELEEFSSYEEGKKIIESKLENTPGITHVYTIQDPTRKVTIYGIGLVDQKIGEKHFLSIIGQEHVAALPYELILEDDEALMLHGRFRFALYWPELTMGTFTQIMSTPGDCEDLLEKLVK